jgi:hypothetical protein
LNTIVSVEKLELVLRGLHGLSSADFGRFCVEKSQFRWIPHGSSLSGKRDILKEHDGTGSFLLPRS